jgi:hypothetical protein
MAEENQVPEQEPVELKPPETTPAPATNTAPAEKPETGKKKEEPKPESEIKVVITLKKGTAMVGLQRTGTDPVFFKIESTNLPTVLKETPRLLVEASKRWQKSAMNPKANIPAPPPPPPRPATATTSRPAPSPAKTKAQPGMPGM